MNSFVMYDKESNSEWIHVTGECASGKFIGKKLQFLPSKVMRWEKWKKLYPETKVLAGQGRGGFMGTYVGQTKLELMGFHVRIGNSSKLYPFSSLKSNKLIHDTYKDASMIIVFSENSIAAYAWNSEVEGEKLKFAYEVDKTRGVMIVDEKSNSRWNPFTGICVDGKFKDRSLEPVIGTPILMTRWKNFYPDGEVYRDD